jgi:histone H3/H4
MSFRFQFWKPKAADNNQNAADNNQKSADKTGGDYFYASEEDEENDWKVAGARTKQSTASVPAKPVQSTASVPAKPVQSTASVPAKPVQNQSAIIPPLHKGPVKDQIYNLETGEMRDPTPDQLKIKESGPVDAKVEVKAKEKGKEKKNEVKKEKAKPKEKAEKKTETNKHNFIFNPTRFKSFVQRVAKEISPGKEIKFVKSQGSLTQIQFSTENMLKKWIEAANLIRATTKRKTLMKEDLKNALRMNKLLSFNVPTELSYKQTDTGIPSYQDFVRKTGGAKNEQHFPLTEIKKFVKQTLEQMITFGNKVRVLGKDYNLIRSRMYRFVSILLWTAIKEKFDLDRDVVLKAIGVLFTKNSKHKTQTEYFDDVETESDREADE